MNQDPLKEIQQLNAVVSHLKKTVLQLERELDFLRRENSRRKNEINSIISVIRKG